MQPLPQLDRQSSASASSANSYDLKTLKKMCRNFPIRPLVSKNTNLPNAWEACSGVVTDPKTGAKKKVRKTFGFEKYGSPEEALNDAKTWITDMRKVSNAEKSAVIALPMGLRTSLLYMAELCEKEGLDVVEMCRLGLETAKARKIKQEITFKEAAAACLAQKKREDLSEAYLKDLTGFYKDSGNTFNDCKLHEITAEDLEDWIDDQDVGSVTWNNYRRKFGVLWSFAADKRNAWVTENVIEDISPKDVKTDEVSALSLKEAKAILKTAHEQLPRLLPYLCIGMFAGLRRSEAQAARWEDIDWETKSIRACGGKMRAVTSRFPHLEEAFLDWMKPIAKSEGPLCSSTKTRREDLKKLRELTFGFDGNIFRHTFGTYHYHGFRNPQSTMVEMGHTTLQMLHKHYRKPVPQTVAQTFWGLNREVVLKEEEPE